MGNWNLQASAGAIGKSMLWRGDWSAALSYSPYDAVASNGCSYISLTSHTNKNPVSNPTDWGLLASGGPIWRGEYNPATTYLPDDAVSYGGSSYICTGTTIGIAPAAATIAYPPPLATTGSRGSIAALPPSDQAQYYARGDNSWQVFFDAMPVGSVVQKQYVETAATGSGTALIPADDSTPQWTEGTLLGALSITITPRYANSQILGRISGQVACSIASTCVLAMFRGTGPGAIAATGFTTPAANYQLPMNFTWEDFPGVTTAVTYNFRFGPNAAATVAFNAVPTTLTRQYGGVSKTTHTVEEIKQ